jgi:hypothetical protein
MDSKNLAPIVLFIYKRPWHSRQTLEALKKNVFASESNLFVFADGPKTIADEPKVREVRDHIRTIGGFKSVSIVEREQNLGLAESITTGVTEVLNHYGSVIVVEDDLICSPYFLSYMNEALRKYEEMEKVMHISAYMYPIDATGLKETIFFRSTSCWGWGTWARAWKHLEYDIHKLIPRFNKESRHKFNMDGTFNFWHQMELNRDGKINSWAIRWYASVFLNNGLCLHPSRSLVNNIGFDGTGVHCGIDATYDVPLISHQITEFEELLEENPEAIKRFGDFMATIKNPFHTRILNLLKRKMTGLSRR